MMVIYCVWEGTQLQNNLFYRSYALGVEWVEWWEVNTVNGAESVGVPLYVSEFYALLVENALQPTRIGKSVTR